MPAEPCRYSPVDTTAGNPAVGLRNPAAPLRTVTPESNRSGDRPAWTRLGALPARPAGTLPVAAVQGQQLGPRLPVAQSVVHGKAPL